MDHNILHCSNQLVQSLIVTIFARYLVRFDLIRIIRHTWCLGDIFILGFSIQMMFLVTGELLF